VAASVLIRTLANPPTVAPESLELCAARQRLDTRNRLVEVDLAHDQRLKNRVGRRVVRYALNPVARFCLTVRLTPSGDSFGVERGPVMLHGRMMQQKIGLWQNRGCLKILDFRALPDRAQDGAA
jgi:hypothetical protein